MRNNCVIQSILIAVSIVVVPLYARAESSEVPTQAHLELRGSYSQICGACIAQGNGGPLTSSPKMGVQLYGDYLPFGWETLIGTFRVGPYGSVSTVGKVGKITTGVAMALRPKNSNWEFFTQTGIRYTTDKMRYDWDIEHGSQGQGAFNLAFGARFDLGNQWYLSLVGEHESNGRQIGIAIFPYNGGFNPGVDTAMIGFGKAF